jgi:lysosomal alpha-mannosidase
MRTGLLSDISIDGKSTEITQNFYYYTTNGGRNSGAYAFHTKSSKPTLISPKATVFVTRGKLVEEVRQVFNQWLSQVIRVYKNKDYVEFDWIVGPLPQDYDMDVITRFETNFKTESTFFTDSNGRQTIERKLNFRKTWHLEAIEKVSSNYYPITSWIFIRDLIKNLQLTVLPDRAQGGSSLTDGSVELMIHRRLSRDDGYGMEEELNELGYDGKGLVVRGKHLLLLSTIEESMKNVKKLSKELFWKPLPMFTTVSKTSLEKILISFSDGIDERIHLLTLEELSQNDLLLRLEFFHELIESESESVSISLKRIFTNLEVIDAIETSLTGIEPKSIVESRKLKWNCSECDSSNQSEDNSEVKDKFTITLYPNEIKTFLLKINRNSNELKMK